MSYYLTVNIEAEGTPTRDDGSSIAGHTWYSLDDGSGNQPLNYGFAPREGATGLVRLDGPGDISHKDDSYYTTLDPWYSRTIEITEEQYNAMKNFGDNPEAYGFDKHYNYRKNSCVDFVYKALSVGGINSSGTEGAMNPRANVPMIDFMLYSANPSSYENLNSNIGSGVWLINGIDPAVGSDFDSASVWVRRADPLTLDLDGDGIETRALVNPDTLTSTSGTSPVYFDYDGNGTRVNTAWISPDDGMLVMDRNNNGTIDNGSELFSDYTLLESGYTAANGYAALKQEDTNYDGVVNNLDANWNNLRIWKDLNTDGISQSDELLTMEQAGITGLNTNATNNQYTFAKTDGTNGNMADVNLAVDTFHQQFTEAIEVLPDVETLPDMQGAGLVRSLHEADDRLLKNTHMLCCAASIGVATYAKNTSHFSGFARLASEHF